ncbi:MAG TPA: DUF87 domain-containing protein [Afifellaceae bacterium]|nr:DUF87 domain-containing protein [Afifellaceae bacterium]
MTAHPIPPAALESHIAILGKTGSGKSNLAKVMVEALLASAARVCVVDPTGTWYGLRLLPNGKPSPWPVVIFGGEHGDLPVAAEHGAAIAETIGTSASPAIVDTRLLTVGARTRFFTDFAEALLRTNRGPLHLVLDEAHLFAPQSAIGGGKDVRQNQMLAAANNLVSLGRGIGLKIILISQRPAKLHKDSLTQVETLVAMRLIAPQDRTAIEAWIKDQADLDRGREILASLPKLGVGDFWLWAPALGLLEDRHAPLAQTFDSGKPLAGSEAPQLKPIDVAAIAGRLEEVAAEALASDPKRLRSRIVQLEGELKKALAAAGRAEASPEQLAAEREQGRHEGWAAAATDLRRIYAEELDQEGLDRCFADIRAIFRDALDATVERMEAGGVEMDQVPAVAPAAAPPVKSELNPVAGSRRPVAIDGNAEDGDRLSGPLQRILDALAWWEALGVAAPSRAQVAFVAGYAPNTGTFNRYLSSLKSDGRIDYPAGGRLEATEEGRRLARAPDGTPTTEELHRRVLDKVSGPLRTILAPLINAYPDALGRGSLAEASGYKANTGTFNRYLSSLRSLELTEYPAPGQVRAAELLFP